MQKDAPTMNDAALLRYAQSLRRKRFSARPFALTILALTLITLLAGAKSFSARSRNDSPPGTVLFKRDVSIADQECHLVHQAADKCAFVLANCPDEEAGVISYLSLYYCRLPHAKPVAFTIMVLWLGVLFSTIGIAASDFFCVNLNTIASMLGMSESLAGVTLLALGNGSPDVFSTFAAFRTHAASLAVGELIGAACFITAVVSGSMALIRPFQVARKSFVRDVMFFLVAAAFSLGFIVDGELHLWESLSMVGFYLFYVAFVVVWHWWLNLRKARKLKAAAMRSHYITPGGDEEEIEEYYDEETTSEARTPARGRSFDDFANLEAAGGDNLINADDKEEERERWMGELTNNMRVGRPDVMTRRNTHTPIRPSLVGAMEFRVVLSALQKSRNIQSMPISLRRYSDDPTYTTAQQQDFISGDSDPASRPPFDVASATSDASPHIVRPSLEVQNHMSSRARAVSTNDMYATGRRADTLHPQIPDITFGPATPDQRNTLLVPGQAPPSPTISLTPPTSGQSSRATSPAPSSRRSVLGNRLAPPDADLHIVPPDRSGASSPSPFSSPVLAPGERVVPPSLKLAVPDASSPPVPFPAYTEYPWSAQSSRPPSLRPRSPSASPESLFPRDVYGVREQPRIPRWWPTQLLPSPYEMIWRLFPTLENWQEKSFFDKLLGIVAAPPVLLLTITLPVVETDKDDDEIEPREPSISFSLPPPRTPVYGTMDGHSRNVSLVLPAESPRHIGPIASAKSPTVLGPRSDRSVSSTASQGPAVYITSTENVAQSPEQLPMLQPPREPTPWDRWLVVIQTFTSPLFVVVVLWANFEPENPHALLRYTLYCLIGSLCVLALLVATSTPIRPPRWRPMLCFVGFAVAIAWISTIANEVVGVLRALGVILNMSDAILGLTIFAVGNSLGDLVADITVARLGYPVMALSACFGGPMLNILLGVGISGSYMVLRKEERKRHKHPEKPPHFQPYHVVVSTTLVISGVTLLVTLVGLLVMVPIRKWKMDKMVGWSLIALWATSTFANVLVEMLGFSSEVS